MLNPFNRTKKGVIIMGLFDGGEKKEQLTNMEQQIRILSTSIEAINQRLSSTDAVAGGYAAGDVHRTSELIEKMADLKKDIAGNFDSINQTMAKLKNDLEQFSKEKDAIKGQVMKLNELMGSFAAVDKKWLRLLIERIDKFNENSGNLNDNLMYFHKNLLERVNEKIGDMGDIVANRLTRTALIGIGVFVGIEILFLILKFVLFPSG